MSYSQTLNPSFCHQAGKRFRTLPCDHSRKSTLLRSSGRDDNPMVGQASLAKFLRDDNSMVGQASLAKFLRDDNPMVGQASLAKFLRYDRIVIPTGAPQERSGGTCGLCRTHKP
jgi:hypothetical protein